MISEKLLSLVGETDKLDELKAIMGEIDAVEAENTTLKTSLEESTERIKKLNEVNANLLLSSVGNTGTSDKEDEGEPDILDMSDDEFDEYFDEKYQKVQEV